MINVIAWIIAVAAWLVIVLAPVALVGLAVVPSWRRWWLRPLLRRVAGRTEFHRAFTESLKSEPEEEPREVPEAAGMTNTGGAAQEQLLHLGDCSQALKDAYLSAGGGGATFPAGITLEDFSRILGAEAELDMENGHAAD